MKVMQVKEYHNQIARVKQEKALARWKERGYSYPVRSMFYFMINDSKGYPITDRLNGYVAFDERSSAFGLNEHKAIEEFNKYK